MERDIRRRPDGRSCRSSSTASRAISLAFSFGECRSTAQNAGHRRVPRFRPRSGRPSAPSTRFRRTYLESAFETTISSGVTSPPTIDSPRPMLALIIDLVLRLRDRVDAEATAEHRLRPSPGRARPPERDRAHAHACTRHPLRAGGCTARLDRVDDCGPARRFRGRSRVARRTNARIRPPRPQTSERRLRRPPSVRYASTIASASDSRHRHEPREGTRNAAASLLSEAAFPPTTNSLCALSSPEPGDHGPLSCRQSAR